MMEQDRRRRPWPQSEARKRWLRLAMVDELHRHSSADLYSAFRELGPCGGQMITETTAEDDEAGPAPPDGSRGPRFRNGAA